MQISLEQFLSKFEAFVGSTVVPGMNASVMRGILSAAHAIGFTRTALALPMQAFGGLSILDILSTAKIIENNNFNVDLFEKAIHGYYAVEQDFPVGKLHFTAADLNTFISMLKS